MSNAMITVDSGAQCCECAWGFEPGKNNAYQEAQRHHKDTGHTVSAWRHQYAKVGPRKHLMPFGLNGEREQ